jgi:hypothetical protein
MTRIVDAGEPYTGCEPAPINLNAEGRLYVGLIVHVTSKLHGRCAPAVVVDFDATGRCRLHWLGGSTLAYVPYKVADQEDGIGSYTWHFIEV